MGRQYGEKFRDVILNNIRIFVDSEEMAALRSSESFAAWTRERTDYMCAHFPWLVEEMRGIADALGETQKRIQLLNLRSWQYREYFSGAESGCASLAIHMKDGAVACAGALDDPAFIYCGAVQRPACEGRFAHITFPIAGTVWASRGLNSQGLSVSISSQLIRGLQGDRPSLNQDIAMRLILESCVTVDDVRAFCEKYAFTMNLVCVDAQGRIVAGHQTEERFFELPAESFAVLTNHLVDDAVFDQIERAGGQVYAPEPTTHYRRGALLRFARERSGSCTEEELISAITDDAQGGRSAVNNPEDLCSDLHPDQPSGQDLYLLSLTRRDCVYGSNPLAGGLRVCR